MIYSYQPVRFQNPIRALNDLLEVLTQSNFWSYSYMFIEIDFLLIFNNELLKIFSPQINKLLLSLSLWICERSKWEIICYIYTLYILPYLLDKLCKFAWTHIQKIWLWKSKPVCMPGRPTRPFNPTCVFRSFM
jgi:hypothetical protein